MRGPRGPRKILKAAQTIIIGISEPMFWVMANQAPVLDSFYITPATFLGSARTPHIQKRKFFSIFVWGLIMYSISIIKAYLTPILGACRLQKLSD